MQMQCQAVGSVYQIDYKSVLTTTREWMYDLINIY